MNRPANLELNTEVYIVSGNHYTKYTKGRIVKILPSGMVDVLTAQSEKPRRFTKNDQEVGTGDSWSSVYLAWDIAAIDARQAEQAAQDKRSSQTAEVLKLIEGRRYGGNKFGMGVSTKARILELVNAIDPTPDYVDARSEAAKAKDAANS